MKHSQYIRSMSPLTAQAGRLVRSWPEISTQKLLIRIHPVLAGEKSCIVSQSDQDYGLQNAGFNCSRLRPKRSQPMMKSYLANLTEYIKLDRKKGGRSMRAKALLWLGEGPPVSNRKADVAAAWIAHAYTKGARLECHAGLQTGLL